MSTFSILILLLHLFSTSNVFFVNALNYRLTAISANSKKESIIECWQLCTPINISTQPGIQGAALQALGPVGNASVAILPPKFDGGLHNAPFNQYVTYTYTPFLFFFPFFYAFFPNKQEKGRKKKKNYNNKLFFPQNRYVAFTAGKAVVTLPCSSATAVVKGGKYGLIFAADTAAVSKLGHYTKYPSESEQTVGIAFPTADGKVPSHTVLHQGQCTEEEMNVVKVN